MLLVLYTNSEELPAFRPDPETIFATKNVDVGLDFARSDEFAIDPTKARGARGAVPTSGACHDTALPRGREGDLCGAGLVAKDDDVGVLFEKGDILSETGGGCSTGGEKQSR